MLATLVAFFLAAAPPPLHVLIVGGGPDKTHNQAAIESNVRYVDRLLPANAPRRILFAGGDPNDANVQWLDSHNALQYRAPQLTRLDGPSELQKVQDELSSLALAEKERPRDPVLLYFTGHGSPNPRSNYENNHYDLWSGQALDVKTLAASISAFPAETPITLVMVQCFSGAFGNELYDGGDSSAALSNHHICGFFASVAQRPAAGCTPEINEADYKDFTSYFFAALSGTDRVGNPVTGADYNHDRKVGMNEAFAYALIHDDSIDTPVCTSDVFLRHAVTTPDNEVFSANYSDVDAWASPAQRAVLRELSAATNRTGEDRLAIAWRDFGRFKAGTEDLGEVRTIRLVRVAKSVILAHTLSLTGDRETKARFKELLAEEAGNPLRR
jgi:hypothetical protein